MCQKQAGFLPVSGGFCQSRCSWHMLLASSVRRIHACGEGQTADRAPQGVPSNRGMRIQHARCQEGPNEMPLSNDLSSFTQMQYASAMRPAHVLFSARHPWCFVGRHACSVVPGNMTHPRVGNSLANTPSPLARLLYGVYPRD
jgi:hypothetical protein